MARLDARWLLKRGGSCYVEKAVSRLPWGTVGERKLVKALHTIDLGGRDAGGDSATAQGAAPAPPTRGAPPATGLAFAEQLRDVAGTAAQLEPAYRTAP